MSLSTPNSVDFQTLLVRFEAKFGSQATITGFSPGRINLIGEHIDYCGGLVLPMAINRGSYAAIRPNNSDQVRVYSSRFNETFVFTLSDKDPSVEISPDWHQFVIGVLMLLSETVTLSGFDLLVEDDIAAGGLSSSASFCLLVAGAALKVADQFDDSAAGRLRLALLCQQVEHQFLGVQCGIMDQASVALGGVIKLDCESLQFQHVSADLGQYQLIVMDSGKARTLASSKYNERVAELAKICHLLGIDAMSSLCQIKPAGLRAAMARIESAQLSMRLKHVISENQRVDESYKYLQEGKVEPLGKLLNQSHESLSRDYEVTGRELDSLVGFSQKQPGVAGARMTGAGFGGCCLALVHRDEVSQHNAAVASAYKQDTGLDARFFTVRAAKGLGFLSV